MAVYQFGPFELDARAAELRRGGRRVPLRPQPCLAIEPRSVHCKTGVDAMKSTAMFAAVMLLVAARLPAQPAATGNIRLGVRLGF